MRFENLLEVKKVDRNWTFKRYLNDINEAFHLLVVENALIKERGVEEIVLDCSNTEMYVEVRYPFKKFTWTFMVNNNEKRLNKLSSFLDDVYKHGF